MLLAAVVETSAAVAATSSRLAKRRLLAETLRAADPGEVAVVATYLSGAVRQRRTGVGWRSLTAMPPTAAEPTLTPSGVDAVLEEIAGLAGPGSQVARSDAVGRLFAAATGPEQQLLRGLLTGELRQGALDALLLDAIAEAAQIPVAAVRRAAMYRPDSGVLAHAALTGGAEALAGFGLEVGQPVRPMLASAAPDVAAALEKVGADAVVDAKIDGIRIQVHRRGEEVRVFTRSLDDITDRVPEIVETVRALDVDAVVLDGEAVALDAEGRARPFQETGSRTMSRDGAALRAEVPLTPYFFDVLHLDGTNLVDAPARERFAALERVVPPEATVARRVASGEAGVQEFFSETLARGHEGVVLKSAEAPYDAGRRGSAWVKVKPRHTLDLVVLAVEWGSGRRTGLLSNIHLGARDGDGFVMLGKTFDATSSHTGWVPVGKTFKGMTDNMLAWQTKRFRQLQVSDDGHVVTLRPEQVVEVAIDGVQRSSRYPGGVALRFARVLRYRDDKTAAEADTIETVRALGA